MVAKMATVAPCSLMTAVVRGRRGFVVFSTRNYIFSYRYVWKINYLMKTYSTVLALIFTTVFLTACEEDKTSSPKIKSDQAILISQDDLTAYLLGRTYHSKDLQEAGLGPNGVIYGSWSITFAEETFNWHHSDIVEQGSYSFLSDYLMSVTLSNTSFSSALDTSTHELEWDGLIYIRSEE